MVSRRSPSQRESRVERQLAALTVGSGRGRLATPRPVRPAVPSTPAPSRVTECIFSKAGPQDGTISAPWPVDLPARVLGIRMACTTAGSTDSVLTAYLDGTAVGTLTLPAGHRYGETRFDLDPDPTDADVGQHITVAVTTVGTGLDTVTATVLLG